MKAGEFLGIGAEECVVVEDAYAGIDAARAAGMKSVASGTHQGTGRQIIRSRHSKNFWTLQKYKDPIFEGQPDISKVYGCDRHSKSRESVHRFRL